MSKTVLVVAPHPDDETLGCGATLFKHLADGDNVHWLIMTKMSASSQYNDEQIQKRQTEIEKVARTYNFISVNQMSFPPAKLDTFSMSEIVGEVSPVIQKVKPTHVYLPYRADVHNDHQVTFDALIASCKAFRAPFIERILAYETLSETDFGLQPEDTGFKPNVWFDVSNHLSQKIDVLKVYQNELAEFPFPRSIEAIEALAKVRGVQCGAHAAEAFILLKEVIK